MPFVGRTRLLVAHDMTEAAYNMYFGLAEFEEMGLVLHALRPDDVFVDVGANIGSYTVIAAGAVGARSFSFEPAPATFSKFLDNIHLNDIASRVSARNMAVGSKTGVINFTTMLDCMNHVSSDSENVGKSAMVPLVTLDDALSGSPVTILKIDVEGFEAEVIKGATAAIRCDSLLAVIMEFNGSGSRYGFDEDDLHRYMIDAGFSLIDYDPLQRKITLIEAKPLNRGNAVYARNIGRLRERVENAPRYDVRGSLL
ncbi:MAG TPA: FkbM family methyltransferase [Candidatus Sulfotelmatobacter sp.]|nr:FkbM family methyltransferase [Candidatus Sulfotelmatobacter sp.]